MPEFSVSYLTDWKPERIKAAIDQFTLVYGHSPTSARVHSSHVDACRAALANLGYTIPVLTTGGTLLGELWLQYNDETRRRPDHA